MSTTVDTWIDQAPDAQRKQLRELRAIILSQAPDVTEALKWGQPCYARRSLFCYLQKAKTHVTLGFQKGALMSDPEGRLEGAAGLERRCRPSHHVGLRIDGPERTLARLRASAFLAQI